MADIVVRFKGEETDLTDALANVDTGATKAAKALAKLEKQEKDAADKAKRLQEEAASAGAQLNGLKFAAQGAGGKLGEMAGRVENAGNAVKVFFANPAVAATAAVVALGAASVLAGAAVGAAFIGITAAADDARKALEPFREEGLGLDEEDTDAVLGAAAAMEAVGLVVDQLVSELGGELAPVVEEVSTVLVAMGLRAIKVFNSFADGANLGRDGLVRLITFGTNPLHASILTAAEGFLYLSQAMGIARPELKEWVRLQQENEDGTKLVGAAVEKLTLTMGDELNQAKQLIGAVREQRAARDKSKEGIDKQAQALERLQAVAATVAQQQLYGIDLIESKRDAQIASVLALAAAAGESAEAQAAAVEAVADIQATAAQKVRDLQHKLFKEAEAEADKAQAENEKRNAEEIKAQQDKLKAIGAGLGKAASMASQGFAAAGDLVKAFGKDADKTAKKVFLVNKAAALVGIALSTGQAIMANLAIGPAGTPLAIAAGAIGAVQFAAAAAQQFDGASVPSAGAGSGGGGRGGRDTSTGVNGNTGGSVGGGGSNVSGSATVAPDRNGGGSLGAATSYRHRDLDIIKNDGASYIGGAFDSGGSTGQLRYD